VTIEIARAAFAQLGGLDGDVSPLAEGMSSTAWLGTVMGTDLVVRTPVVAGPRPAPRYAVECALNERLRRAGVPAADTRVLVVDGVVCTAAPRLPGRPVRPDGWGESFVADVARALHATHSLPTRGWGQPTQGPGSLLGNVSGGAEAAVQRFWLARIWPFDDTRLSEHPAASLFPEKMGSIAAMEPAIREEAERDPCLVHTDLHWDHLLRDENERLAGLLDFGDAFIGSVAWDFACLRYYHGETATEQVTGAYAGGDEIRARARILGVAFALYKIDKTPTRSDVIERAEPML
jgi:aminoglycoside phosphotransferase (APT) family kinase protein